MLYGVYTIVIAFAHYRHETQGKALGQDTSSLFNLWKVCTAFFNLMIVDHLIITIFYWGLVHSTLDPPHNYWRIMKHSVPLPLLLIDFMMSAMIIEFRLLSATVFYAACYASLLITYTYTKKPDTVYTFAHLESLTSWLMVGMVIVASFMSHLVFATISRWRHKNSSVTAASSAIQ